MLWVRRQRGGARSSLDEERARLKAIESAQATVDFQPDGTVIRANERFLSVMGYALDEIVGQHHRMFVEPEYAETDEYQQFWARLRRGERVVDEFKRVGKGQRIVWVQAAYCPVLSPSGVLERVLKIASDVTARQVAVDEAARVISALAEGDLQQRMEGAFEGLFGQLQGSINRSLESFERRAGSAGRSAAVVTGEAQEIAEERQPITAGFDLLNASVAARAGEAMEGFAAVTAEVRLLTQRAAEASEGIRKLVADTYEAAEMGASQAERIGATVLNLSAESEAVGLAVHHLAAAASSQREAVSRVSEAVEMLQRRVLDSAAGIERARAALERSSPALSGREGGRIASPPGILASATV